MKEIIYAKSLALNTMEELKVVCEIHSIFKKGINIRAKNNLIFIGTDENGNYPLAIHLWEDDIEKLRAFARKDIFRVNRTDKRLILQDKIIDLNRANYYSSRLPREKKYIREESLEILLGQIMNMNFTTGLDMEIKDLFLKDNSLIGDLRKSMVSKDNEYIQKSLRRIIGRGKGLTPSGDDLLIGLIWTNDIRRIFSREFVENLKRLILEENLTTDISQNYYKAAFSGKYGSRLIDLCNGLINPGKNPLNNYIHKILNHGHTSGMDTLSGIALGIGMIMGYGGGFSFENSNWTRWKCIR